MLHYKIDVQVEIQTNPGCGSVMFWLEWMAEVVLGEGQSTNTSAPCLPCVMTISLQLSMSSNSYYPSEIPESTSTLLQRRQRALGALELKNLPPSCRTILTHSSPSLVSVTCRITSSLA